MPAAPAQMEADPLWRQTADRMVERVDPGSHQFPVIFNGWLRVDLVPALGEAGVIQLQDDSGINDGLVLLAHRIGAGVEKFLVALVVAIADPGAARRSNCSHEALCYAGHFQRRIE